MNKNNNSSFKDLNLFDKVIVITALIFPLTFSVSIVVGSVLFGIAGFLSLTGMQYESLYSLLLFVLVFYLIGLILDLFSIFIIKLLSQNLVGTYKLFLIRMITDCIFSWLSLYTVDEIINR